MNPQLTQVAAAVKRAIYEMQLAAQRVKLTAQYEEEQDVERDGPA